MTQPTTPAGHSFIAGDPSAETIAARVEGFARDGYRFSRVTPVAAPVAGVWIEVWLTEPEVVADFVAPGG